MESLSDSDAALAALAWQIELGATEAIGDVPVDRYALAEKAPAARAAPSAQKAPLAPGPVRVSQEVDAVAIAKAVVSSVSTLEALRDAMVGFEHCELKKGARNTVFADGMAGSRVMIIGEAPGRDEDREGRPFVGRAGQLLDRMLGAIGLGRAENVYITNVLPWRPPQNRDPKPEEIAMLKPFLERHVALAQPQVLVLMGNISCTAVLGRRGITRMRGNWEEAMGLPTLPMFHPAYLLRNPQAKREAWADLLSLNARLKDLT